MGRGQSSKRTLALAPAALNFDQTDLGRIRERTRDLLDLHTVARGPSVIDEATIGRYFILAFDPTQDANQLAYYVPTLFDVAATVLHAQRTSLSIYRAFDLLAPDSIFAKDQTEEVVISVDVTLKGVFSNVSQRSNAIHEERVNELLNKYNAALNNPGESAHYYARFLAFWKPVHSEDRVGAFLKNDRTGLERFLGCYYEDTYTHLAVYDLAGLSGVRQLGVSFSATASAGGLVAQASE